MPLTSQPLDLPFSEACERNKQPLLEALRAWLPQPPDRPVHVLEVGSGTGQHGAHFSEHLPVRWQLSDRPEHLPGLRRRQVQVSATNASATTAAATGQLLLPLQFDVTQPDWPAGPFDAVFSANTAHIMPATAVPDLFAGSARVLAPGGLFLLYGPFHDGGVPTSASNAAFDAHLRAIDPAMGVRDSLELIACARAVGFSATANLPLPANNRLLVFRCSPTGT
jgi:SAM-dependent methyltransferase